MNGMISGSDLFRQQGREALAEWESVQQDGDDIDQADAGERMADFIREFLGV